MYNACLFAHDNGLFVKTNCPCDQYFDRDMTHRRWVGRHDGMLHTLLDVLRVEIRRVVLGRSVLATGLDYGFCTVHTCI